MLSIEIYDNKTQKTINNDGRNFDDIRNVVRKLRTIADDLEKKKDELS